MDLLPRKINRYDLNFIKNRVESGRTRDISAYAVSAATGEGLVELAEGLLLELAGKDVFVVGAANVGKSTLVKNLTSLLARTLRFRGRNKYSDDQRKGILQNLNTTQSHLPGTTLQALRIPCFPSMKHALWDTPGIINQSALSYSLFPSHFMEPLAYPTKIDIPTKKNGRKVNVRKGFLVLIEAGWINDEDDNGKKDSVVEVKDDGDWSIVRKERLTLARLDILEDNRLAVEVLAFIPNCLNIRVVPTAVAPKDATIPEDYVKKVQHLVGENHMTQEVSRPLTVFKGGGGPSSEDGEVKFHAGDKHDNNGFSGWVRRDICFASLGWLMLSHPDSFSVNSYPGKWFRGEHLGSIWDICPLFLFPPQFA